MYCSTCGKEIDNTALFCKHCGSAKAPATIPSSERAQTATDEVNPTIPIAPVPQPPKEKMHWYVKDRIAKAVCTFIVFALILPAINHFKPQPISNPDAQRILSAVYPGTQTSYQAGFEAAFEKPKWEFIGPRENGDVCIEFTGRQKRDPTKKTLIQLSWSKEQQSVYCNWMEVNGEELVEVAKKDSFFTEEDEPFMELLGEDEQLISYQIVLDAIFEPYFSPELLAEKERELDRQIEEALAANEQEQAIESPRSSPELANDEPRHSEAEYPKASSAPIAADAMPFVNADIPVAAHLIGLTLGDIIDTYGENFILPEEYFFTGSRYLYYNSDKLPYYFLFNPAYNTPSDEDVIVAIFFKGPGWITADVSSNMTKEQMRKALGAGSDADMSNFYIGDCEIAINWVDENNSDTVLMKQSY